MSSDQHRSHHRGSSRYAHRAMGDVAYAPSSASSSDNSDRGTHSNYSSSRRVLAHVLARKERDSKQMHQLLKLTFSKLDEESRRATDAERRTAECLVRARTAIDARAQADADAAAARAEVSLYKMQLEQAQREIFRAQEMLDGLEARRHDAEEDAARARSVARKMQEERAIEAAREEGKQQGWREGLRRGMILGRQEAEDELRSRRREDDLPRSRSRRRRLEETLFSQVAPDLPEQSSSEGSSPDDVPPRGTSGTRNGSRRTPEIAPLTPAPAVPRRAAPFRSSSPSRPFGRGPEPASRRHNEQTSDSPELSQSRQRSRSRPRMETPVPEPAHSRPYTPHDDSTPSIIQPIPVPASASSAEQFPMRASPSPTHVHHPPVQIPPDNWIPRAQDAAGDGHLSIFLPPPHELVEPVRVPEGPYAITATPEEGSPAVVPPPPDLSPSPGTPGTMRRSPPEYAYVMPPPPPPPPDLGPAVRTPRHSRSRDYAYVAAMAATPPPPPDFGPAVPISRLPMTTQRSRDYVNVNAPLPPPPPPDLGPAVSHQPRTRATHATPPPPQRIAKVASNHSRASTHLSEFDLLAPVEQPRGVSAIGKGRAARGTIGPPPAEEEELEYVDAVTEPIPRQPIAHHSNLNSNPNPPLLQRRRAYEHTNKRPSRGPRRPSNIIMPAPLSQQAAEHPAGPLPPQPLSSYVPSPHVYMPPPQLRMQNGGGDGDGDEDEVDEDAPIFVPAVGRERERERSQPHRSRTQSSGVIGISVEPPSPGGSPPSAGAITGGMQRRLDLLSPEHAERSLPMPMSITTDPFVVTSRNKPQPPLPQPHPRSLSSSSSPPPPLAQPPSDVPLTLTPLPELADLPPGFVPPPTTLGPSLTDSEPRRHRRPARSHTHTHTHTHARGVARYEAAPIPMGTQYPDSPLVGMDMVVVSPGSVPGKGAAAMTVRGEGDTPLSPLSVASGFLSLKSRLPWRRNTAK